MSEHKKWQAFLNKLVRQNVVRQRPSTKSKSNSLRWCFKKIGQTAEPKCSLQARKTTYEYFFVTKFTLEQHLQLCQYLLFHFVINCALIKQIVTADYKLAQGYCVNNIFYWKNEAFVNIVDGLSVGAQLRCEARLQLPFKKGDNRRDSGQSWYCRRSKCSRLQ